MGDGAKVTILDIDKADLLRHHAPDGVADRIALALTRFAAWIADTIFGRRYGDRVIVLETVAAVPPMVAGTLLHLKCLRRMTTVRLPPPRLPGGIKGSTSFHSSSVRSLG